MTKQKKPKKPKQYTRTENNGVITVKNLTTGKTRKHKK